MHNSAKKLIPWGPHKLQNRYSESQKYGRYTNHSISERPLFFLNLKHTFFTRFNVQFTNVLVQGLLNTGTATTPCVWKIPDASLAETI